MPLSDYKISAIKHDPDKNIKVTDYNNLYLLCTPSRSKLWKVKFKFNGRESILALGKYPAVSLKDARHARDEAQSNIAKGIDPQEQKRKSKLENEQDALNSFRQVGDEVFKKAEAEGRSTATLKKMKGHLEYAYKDFGHKPIKDITATTILATLKKHEKLGHHETANRIKSRISSVFRYAIACGYTDNDPTYGLRNALIQPNVKHRAAITDKPTLKCFVSALEGYNGQVTTIIAFKLLILFSARQVEILKAEWSEFDIEKRIWNVPETRMKMRKPHSVPLSQPAIDLLEKLRTLTGMHRLLFPSQTSAHKPMSENTLNQALRRMGFGPEVATAHGFRATFSTLTNGSGLFNSDVIEAYCSRQDTNAVRRVYNRSNYWNERVELANWWSELLDFKT